MGSFRIHASVVRECPSRATWRGGLLAFGLLALTACGSSTKGPASQPDGPASQTCVPTGQSDAPGLQFTVNGLSQDVSSLQVSATRDTAAREPLAQKTVCSNLSQFTLQLPADVTGPIRVQIAALNGGGTPVGWVEKSLQSPGEPPGTVNLLPPIHQGMISSLWGDANGRLYIGGKAFWDRGDVPLVYQRLGVGWSASGLLSGSNPIFGMWGTGPNDLWGVAAQIFHFDGFTWTETRYPAPYGPIYAVWGTSTNNVWAVGDIILHWDGTAWSVAVSDGTSRLHGLWGSGPSDIWAVGESNTAGVIKHWDGTGWTPSPIPGAPRLYKVWGSGPSDVWAVGDGPQSILHWDGTSWTVAAHPGAPSLRGIWGSGPGDVWAAGVEQDQGVLLHWDGTAWTDAHPPATVGLSAVWGSTANDVWAVGPPGVGAPVLLHWDGTSWAVYPFLASP